jgi:hypothetical protein
VPSDVGARADHVVVHASTCRADAMLIEIDSISPIGPTFLKGWMITTEMVPSWSGKEAREHVQNKYGDGISQFGFTQEYLVEHERRMARGKGSAPL